MKKILYVLLCFILLGCQSSQVTKEKWSGTYHRDDVQMVIGDIEEEDGDELFSYEIFYQGESYEDYALIDSKHENMAISDFGEDGHCLKMTLKEHSVLVEESEGLTYLGIDLSGEYEE